VSEPSVALPPAGWWWRVALLLLRRPGLWATAVVQVFRLARPGWWRRPPFLPVPDPTYLRFRLETQYGGEGTERDPDPADLLAFLHWAREFPR